MKFVDFPEFVWIWNRHQGLTMPDLHMRMARWLDNRWEQGDRELALLAFRNSGKSTLVGLYSAWLLLDNPNLRILVLAADFALSKKMARNVKRVIERHPLTTRLKPRRADQWASDQFTVRRRSELRDPSMLAKGIDANITGLRADIVICDDVEVPNTCDTAAKRLDLRSRLREIDYVLVPGGLQLYVGTPHNYYTIYSLETRLEAGEERPFLDGFRRLELPLIDNSNASQWPERFPLERIESIRLRTGPSKFDSQMMLKPRNPSEGRLDPDQLQSYDCELIYSEGNGESMLTLGGRRLVSASCWWDPSYGSPGKGDASVVAVVFTDQHGGYWLHRIKYIEHDPEQIGEMDAATQMCRQVASFAKEFYIPAVNLETNGLGKFLPGLLRQQLQQARLGIPVLEKVSTTNKHLRILEAFDAVLAANRLHAHQSVWTGPFTREMREWRPGAKTHDDGLDAVAGCLLCEPVRLPRGPWLFDSKRPARPTWRPGLTTVQANAEFPL